MSSISSTSSSLIGAGRLNVTGLASGLDVEKIIQGLLTIEQKRIEKLQAQSERVTSQQTAFKGIEARLLSLQGQLFQMARPQNGAFEVKRASSSDENIVTAATTPSAQPGIYQFKVNQLAQNHQIASQGYDSANALVTQGTFQIGLGSGASATISIDGTNNTLQGLANAINATGIGVTAQIVNDGSASYQQPFRLLLSSSKTGASNAITITNTLGADSGTAIKPEFNQTYTGKANLDPAYTGTSVPSANTGSGTYTGLGNNTYTFTVVGGGLVGTDNNLQIAYQDASGANTGTIVLNAADAGVNKTVAQGLEVSFAAGTLIAGQKFTLKAFAPEVQQATDASITLGSGAGALTVQNASNQVDGLFPGITLDLHSADSSKTIALTVASDTTQARKSIQDFVNGFNGLMEYVDEQVKFDAETQAAGILIGDRQATTIQNQLRETVLQPIAGLKSAMNRLSNIGITISDKGRLVLDSAKLDDVLAGRVAGVNLEDVRRLFTLGGTSEQPGVQFVTASSKTRASGTPYQVVVTQAAERATVQAANPLAASTLIDATNNALTVKIDGLASTSITLQSGTYSRLALAQELQTRINSSPTLAGRGISVGLNGDALVVTSNAYGATSQVALESGSSMTALGFTAGQSDIGQDVGGHFLVNGQMENATGSGQLLIGTSTNANTADLQVRVTLTAAQIGAGLSSNLTITRGVASGLDQALSRLLDPITGRLKSINNGYQETIDSIQQTITRQNETSQRRRDSLLRQFVTLETTISQLQSLGSYLTSQFAQINNLNLQRR